MRASGLERSTQGRAWLDAGETSLTKVQGARMPFRETGGFPINAAYATACGIILGRGRRLKVTLTLDEETASARASASTTSGSRVAAPAPTAIFVDLFRRDGEGPPRHVTSREDQPPALEYEVDSDGVSLLRLQPELLRGGRFTLTQRTLATLRFPIDHLKARAVQSFFGAERDGGARAHRGVDIFAP